MPVTRVALTTMTANEVSLKWVDFLKDLSAYGMDVTYEEQVTSGGTWDPVADKMAGGTTEPVQTVFTKKALLAPVYFSNSTQNSGQEKTGFALGHQLNDVTQGETMCVRMHISVPLTKTGTYYMLGIPWKIQYLIDSYSVGKRVFWNQVQFEKA